LSAFEGLHRQGASKTWQIGMKPNGQRFHVKGVAAGNGLGTYKMVKVAHMLFKK
jgi:hypothetical protein